jgi:hypothetical protein
MTAMKLLENKQVFSLLKVLGWQCVDSEKYKPKSNQLPSVIAVLDKQGGSHGLDRTFFPLVGKQYQTFENVKNLLLKEPCVKNRSRKEIREIKDALFDYCRDIIKSKERIKNEQDMDTKAKAFLDRVLLPEQEWLVV